MLSLGSVSWAFLSVLVVSGGACFPSLVVVDGALSGWRVSCVVFSLGREVCCGELLGSLGWSVVLLSGLFSLGEGVWVEVGVLFLGVLFTGVE